MCVHFSNNHDPDDYNEIFIGSKKSLRVSRFVKDAPLKIVIHGFMSSPFVGPARALRAGSFLKVSLINVLNLKAELYYALFINLQHMLNSLMQSTLLRCNGRR